MAYSHAGILYLATGEGRTVKSISTVPPIGNFAISPDGKTAIFTPLNQRLIADNLFSLNVSTGNVEKLTRGPYYYRSGHGSEGYSDPSFSPNGQSVVFAVHAERAGDAVETAGPLAIMDLRTRKVTILKSTTKVSEGSAAYANAPQWSPDGKHVLVNFEAGSAITTEQGDTLESLDSRMGGSVQFSLGWIGASCVVYVAGADFKEADSKSAKVLNLNTGRTEALNEVATTAPATAMHLVSVSWPVRVRSEGSDFLVLGTNGEWRIRDASGNTFVRAIPEASGAPIPSFCK